MKTLRTAGVAALLLSAAPVHAQDVTLRYAFQNPESHPLGQAAQVFGDKLSELTDGAVAVQLYAGAQLGDVTEVVQNLQLGAIDMTLAKPGHVADLGADAFNVLGLPYILTDQAHMERVLHGGIGEDLLAGLSEINLHGVGFYLDSPRHFFFVDAPVDSVEDMAGLKIRSLTSDVAVETIEAFGASATPMAFSELYGALQAGVVDGADQPLTGFYAQQYQEIAKHIVLDGHDAAPTIILMSQQAWNQLSPDQQAAVGEAHQAAADFFLKLDTSENERIRGELEAAGVTIVDVEDKAPWQAAVEPVVAQYADQHGDLIEAIRSQQ